MGEKVKVSTAGLLSMWSQYEHSWLFVCKLTHEQAQEYRHVKEVISERAQKISDSRLTAVSEEDAP